MDAEKREKAMPDERMIQTTSARIILAGASGVPGEKLFKYELCVPKLLSKEQMKLILEMVRQMKQGGFYSDGVRLMWSDEIE